MFNRLFIFFQFILPQHFLSLLMGKLTAWQAGWLTYQFIQWFVRVYRVDMRDAATPDLQDYPSFNAFFTRALRPESRPFASVACISPVDGVVSQCGTVRAGVLLQAKGHDFSLLSLLAGDANLAQSFVNAGYCTLYLSPRDYHRVHIPMSAQLTEMIYVAGSLFSVNNATAAHVPDLFARNERVICLFETAHGKLAVILVGALCVGSMATVWAGTITPPYRKGVVRWRYTGENRLFLERGAEMGRFNMGSTVIVLLENGAQWQWIQGITAGASVRMGEGLADVVKGD